MLILTLVKPVAEHKTETAAMGELQATVKTLSSELADKVGEIQKQDKIVKDLQTSQVECQDSGTKRS